MKTTVKFTQGMFSDTFYTQYRPKKKTDGLSSLLFSFDQNTPWGKSKKIKWGWNLVRHISLRFTLTMFIFGKPYIPQRKGQALFISWY